MEAFRVKMNYEKTKDFRAASPCFHQPLLVFSDYIGFRRSGTSRAEWKVDGNTSDWCGVASDLASLRLDSDWPEQALASYVFKCPLPCRADGKSRISSKQILSDSFRSIHC